jgi:hypothetical protein
VSEPSSAYGGGREVVDGPAWRPIGESSIGTEEGIVREERGVMGWLEDGEMKGLMNVWWRETGNGNRKRRGRGRGLLLEGFGGVLDRLWGPCGGESKEGEEVGDGDGKNELLSMLSTVEVVRRTRTDDDNADSEYRSGLASHRRHFNKPSMWRINPAHYTFIHMGPTL